jgi:NAD(P)-dependent dehydrogenase (short-subunit alcohol dehydrogenase family)
MTAALIIGAGDATGGAIARAFAAEGYTTCVNRRPRHADKLEALAASIRDSGHEARAFPADARDEDAMITLVETVEREVGPIDVAVFNIGANVRFAVTDTSATIIFTGATASLRGGDGFSAFSGAKAALRMLAQSMARELGPQGIHVAHVVIDGGIDTEFVRGLRPDFEEAKAHDLVLSPVAIAAQYVMLHKQHRSAWTHELDLRPWGEKF